MTGVKICRSLKLCSDLTGNHHALCHDSYNLPFMLDLSRPKKLSWHFNPAKVEPLLR